MNLGVDSFIFVDDNPVECAEVKAACPEVLTLRLPFDGNIEEFLRHVWAFDRLRMTAEDRQRTMMYRQEADRARFQKEAPAIGEFLAGLDLRVAISEPAIDQFDRIAQLTQRTNQFNFTTIRRNEAEILRLAELGLECRCVEVSDRFGDYGLVGVMIFGHRSQDEVLEIDTFLLSCRVLGRGVEHAMLNALGEIAGRRQVSLVAATLIPTAKNQPARDFLEEAAGWCRQQVGGNWRYEIPSDVAAAVVYNPERAVSSREQPTGQSLLLIPPVLPREPFATRSSLTSESPPNCASPNEFWMRFVTAPRDGELALTWAHPPRRHAPRSRPSSPGSGPNCCNLSR